MHLGKALIQVRKAKGLKPYQVYPFADISSSDYGQLGKRRFPRSIDRHVKALQVPSAAVLLYAVDEAEIPAEFQEFFRELKNKIIQ